ncbi:hypothetical protein H4O20_08615 [Aequorivita sp. 609]|uniref:hypothetical protein n=1 Tax=Aequorivita TaxID=153265 RepID=UPI0013EC8649|nr:MULTISPECIES: hypothetical protein [Aequorivita]MBB6681504.1 hypothetical protein [Aequorivita sp. 609]NGX85275.1 hypothetical protein [Aequorivita sp. KMM 9714]
MNILDRYKKPTPKFFKILRNVGIALGASGAAILTAPITLPATLISIASYLTVAGTVVTAVSQAVVSDGEELKNTENNN